MATPDVDTIVEYGKISEFLWMGELANQRAFKGGTFINKDMPTLVRIIRSAVEWAQGFGLTPSPEANYLYTISKSQQAKIIIGNLGGIVIVPTIPGSGSLAFYFSQFTVGAVGSPMANGETQLIIDVGNAQLSTVQVTADGFQVPRTQTNSSGQLSYGVLTTATTSTFSFSQSVDDQLIIIRFDYTRA